MKAVRLQAYGDVDQLRYEDAPNPVPGAGEALVKIAVSGLNPVDLIVRKGLFAQIAPLQFPAILGVDAAGTIVAVGAGVTEFAVGDRVVAHVPLNGKGAYAEMVAAPVAGIAKLPANLSFEAGATLPLVALTGQQAVDLLGVKRGDRVLVSGALGAVGRVAVEYLQELGAVPVAGVRAARLAEGRALAGDALEIDLEPSSPDFDYAIAVAAPAAANTVKHVRDGGKVASAVQIPEGRTMAVLSPFSASWLMTIRSSCDAPSTPPPAGLSPSRSPRRSSSARPPRRRTRSLRARAGRSCWWSKPKREARLSAWERAPGARACHPCEEHLVPLMIVAGNLDR